MMAKNPYEARATFSKIRSGCQGGSRTNTFRYKQRQTAKQVTTGTTCLESNYFNTLPDAISKIHSRIGKVNPCCPSSING
jgi:hypothetical protein